MSRKTRASRALGATLLLGGVLLAVAPGASATDTLPAPAPPQLLSASASGTVKGLDTITVTFTLSPSDYDNELWTVYGNGYPTQGGYVVSRSGDTVTERFPLCAGVIPPATIECATQQDVDSMQIGSTITVTETGQNLSPILTYSEESAPSNALKVTVG